MAMMVPRLSGRFGIVSHDGSGMRVGLLVNCGWLEIEKQIADSNTGVEA